MPSERVNLSLTIYNGYLIVEDEGADEDEDEVKTPQKLKQSFLDTNGRERAKSKPIYNYKPTHKFSKRGTSGDKNGNDANKDDER